MKTWQETRQLLIEIDAKFAELPEKWEDDIDLQGANLEGANLRYANLQYANLEGANLRYANLRYANLRYVNLQDANLQGANLEGANLRYAKGIVAIQFSGFSIYIQSRMAKIGCRYMSHKDWGKIDIETAVKMGIKREHFEVYHAFFKAALMALEVE